MSGETDAVDSGKFLRKQALLHLAGNFHFAMDAFALRGFAGQRSRKVANLQRESGLSRD